MPVSPHSRSSVTRGPYDADPDEIDVYVRRAVAAAPPFGRLQGRILVDLVCKDRLSEVD